MARSNDILELRNKRLAQISGVIVHLLILLLFFLPYFKSKPQPEVIQGIVVNFDTKEGIPETAENPTESSNSEQGEVIEDEESSIEEEFAEDLPEEVPSEPNSSEPLSPVVEEENQSQVEEKERERLEKEAAEVERIAQQKKEEEEAREQAAFEEQKKKFGNLFNGSQNEEDGQGEGADKEDALEELTSSTKNIGGGLKNRGVIFEPSISDDSQKTGTVVIEVCVNQGGKVIEAKWTQRGSTTTDSKLIEIAKNAAFKYKFETSEVERQCGSISILFELQ